MEINVEGQEKLLKDNNIKYERDKLIKVVDYCNKMYGNNKRHGIYMSEHAEGVAELVAILRIDDISIYSALLHGIVRLEEYKSKEVQKLFGKEIVEIIETVNKLSYLNIKTDKKIDNENIRKMFMGVAKDIRTVIIKLSDRLYNMRHIKNIDNEVTKTLMAKEGLLIYAPIAHRLGMSQVKSEIEDISFRFLMIDEYNDLKKQIDAKKKQREEYIQNRIDEIKEALNEQGIEATIYGRPKHFYSIYKKMKQKNCMAEDLFDLLAIRIIVDSVKNCYSSLGIVHDMYKPMPGRFKDYIAVPKVNMYQSLHTTVFGEDAKPFEIQIRTWDMHKIAENGIAAHFSYKEKNKKITDADKKIVWIRQALELQKELQDNSENLNKLKVELFGEEVFVFTPKGDIKALPKGSTPIDFAYAIHQKIAEKMVGAKVNSRLVPLSYKLGNTDVIEIITNNTSNGPNADWLKYVKTTSAKNKITSFLKKKSKTENVAKGKEIFDKYIKKQKYSKDSLLQEKYINDMLKKSGFKNLDECYENVGFGSISIVKIMNRLCEAYKQDITPNSDENRVKKNTKNSNDLSNLVKVQNIKNCKVNFAKCCSPIPGDEIVGYITFSNGVSVHRNDCNNLKSLDLNRTIEVEWQKEVKKAEFVTKISVRANSRQNLFTDVLNELNNMKINVVQMNTNTTLDRENIMNITVAVKDVETLNKVLRNIKKIDSVFEARRVH